MKRLIIIVSLLTPATLLFAQKEKRYIHQGNKLYEQQQYAEAEASYKKSVAQSKTSEPGNFNLGDALYKQKKFDLSAQKFTEIASSAKDKSVKAQAYHNLGNSLFQAKKLEESIDAYKKALLNNPKDDQTRYNLAYAQEKLKQQQQQDKKDKNKDKNKKDQDKDQSKDKDKDKKDQDKKDQDKKDQDKKDQKNQDKKDQDKNKENQKDQQQGQQPNQLSKEDAERMLEALNQQEKNTQDKLKNKKATGVKGRIVKDW